LTVIIIGKFLPVGIATSTPSLILAPVFWGLGTWDGWLSYNSFRGSTNFRRVLFGNFLGVGLYLVLVNLVALSGVQ